MKVTSLTLLGLMLFGIEALPGDGVDLRDFMRFVNPSLKSTEIHDYYSLIKAASKKYSVDYRLIASVISVESKFKRGAVGIYGEVGLMQLRPIYFGAPNKLSKPRYNIDSGVRYIKYLEKKLKPRYKDIRYIEHYNRGPNRTATKFKYAKKVHSYYKMLSVRLN